MNDIEKQARELLAAEFRKEDQFEYAHHVAVGGDIDDEGDQAALRAIIAALTQPEGFVLVPVEPTDDMVWAPSDVEVGYPTWAGSKDGCTTDEAKAIWAAMLAARPEARP